MALFETRPITVSIARAAAEVYAFAQPPEAFPKWTAGLGADLTRDGDRWIAHSPDAGRVVDGEDDLLVRQPGIGGVQHRAQAGHGVEQLQVPVGVPGQGGDPVAGPHAQPGQGVGRLGGAPGQAFIVVAPERSIRWDTTSRPPWALAA